MTFLDDLVAGLAEEVVSEMACRFFGSRKEMEETLQVFSAYVKALREKEKEVNRNAAFLGAFFLYPEIIRDFYRTLHIEPDIFPTEGAVASECLPLHLPSAWSLRGEYIQWVAGVYDTFQKSCEEYIHGRNVDDLRNHDPDELDPGYLMILEMVKIINQKIDKINNEMSPDRILRCHRRFDPECIQKSRLTGASIFSGEKSTLNQSMAFDPVDLDALNLREIPIPPARKTVDGQITKFCKTVFSRHTEPIKTLLADLKRRQKEAVRMT